MPRGAADARPALACARSPGPAPAAPAGRQLLTRLGPPPAPPAVLRDRASARELDKRRNEIARVLRRLKGFRRLFTRFEQRAVLFLGFIVFALIINALR